jgi:hypothetical protein
MKQLELAENWGYTTREVVHLEGRGHPYKVNKITSKGKKLLKELGLIPKKTQAASDDDY